MRNKFWSWLLFHSRELWIAFFISAIAATGWLDELDDRVSDWLYQRHGAISPDIVVVGIDSKTLDRLGPLPLWLRKEMPKVIAYLNEDPSTRPAVIGLDFLFTGYNAQAPDVDDNFAEVVAKYGNVVVASDVIENEEYSEDDPYAVWNKTWTWDAPFAKLLSVADTGHICEPYDKDGVTRHQLLYVNVTERGRLYSFARVIYEKFCQHKGITPNAPPKTEDNGLYYLPFTAKSYNGGISFIDLLEGKVRADFFRDKIVLIGSYATGMGDEFSTALERSSVIYGIDLHANAIQAFQNGFFPREAGQNLQLIILFLVSFMATIFFRNGKMSNVLAMWLIICLGWFGICKLFYHSEIILHVLWVPLVVSVLFIGAVAFNYIHARAERDIVTSTFGRYVDPTIMRQLLKDKTVDVGGSMKNIAVLFVDIRGFTTMSEQLPPTTVVEILNKYLTLTTNCIRRHHGTLLRSRKGGASS